MSLEVHGYTTGPFAENTYIAIDTETQLAAVIDPGMGALEIWRKYEEKGITLDKILLTHAHLDHIFGLKDLKEATEKSIWLHSDDDFLIEGYVEMAEVWGIQVEPAPPADYSWEHGDEMGIGNTTFEIRHTPGHSPGSVSLVWDHGVFTGDALFAGGIGRTDFPHSNYHTLERAIQDQLYTLPEHLTIYPGHMGTSTIGAEMKSNPSVRIRD